MVIASVLLLAGSVSASVDVGYIVLGMEPVQQPHSMTYSEHTSEGMPEVVVIGRNRYSVIGESNIYKKITTQAKDQIEVSYQVIRKVGA